MPRSARLSPPAARRRHARPRRRERRSREARSCSALVVRADELGCLDDEVAHQLGVDRERPHREHGRRRVEQTPRRERRRGHREGAAGRGRSRTAPSPTRADRPAKVRASAAARASAKIRRCDIRPKLPTTCDRRCIDTDAPDDFDRPGPRSGRLDARRARSLAIGARTTEDIFTGVSQSMPLGRVYGGQVLAQSIVAAERTIPDGRTVHSMHGYFLRPGDCVQGHHVLGGPHPRRPFVLDAPHAGLPGGRADLLDDRVVPGRGSRDSSIRPPMPDGVPGPGRAARPRGSPRGPAPGVQAAVHRPPAGSAARPLADLPDGRGRARAAAGGVDANAARDPRRPRASTARRSPT